MKLLKLHSCKFYNNKYMIASTQITKTEIFPFIWYHILWHNSWLSWRLNCFYAWVANISDLSRNSRNLKASWNIFLYLYFIFFIFLDKRLPGLKIWSSSSLSLQLNLQNLKPVPRAIPLIMRRDAGAEVDRSRDLRSFLLRKWTYIALYKIFPL